MGFFITAIPSTHAYVSTIPYGLTPVTGSSCSNANGTTWKLIDTSSDFTPLATAFLNPMIGWAGRADSPDPNGGVYKWKLNASLDNPIVTADEKALIDKAIVSIENNTTHFTVYPNPVVHSAIISFHVQQEQQVSLQVFDMNGRLIITLANARMQRGTHQFIWNAREEKGNAVAAGVHLLKLQTGNYSETTKILILQ